MIWLLAFARHWIEAFLERPQTPAQFKEAFDATTPIRSFCGEPSIKFPDPSISKSCECDCGCTKNDDHGRDACDNGCACYLTGCPCADAAREAAA